MKNKLVIVNTEQFGYHTDTYKYCEYLRNNYEIIYICFDEGKKKIYLNNIRVIYIKVLNLKIIKYFFFVFELLKLLKSLKSDIVFIKYFYFCSIITFFYSGRIILDIRTSTINRYKIIRYLLNILLKIELKSFENITVISESLKKYLNINRPVSILSLGSDLTNYGDKVFSDNIEMLYVGTFFNRRITDTILGIKIFLEKTDYKIPLNYNIIGFGTKKEKNEIINFIKDKNLDKHCVFHGELRNKELDVFFNKSNVGVAYVPITDYYNCQPMTKLFEYLLAGMACIATYTEENMKIVNRNNGVLCYDTPTSFSNAIEELWCNRFLFNSKIIKQDAYSYTWQNIIEKQLIHILNNTKK